MSFKSSSARPNIFLSSGTKWKKLIVESKHVAHEKCRLVNDKKVALEAKTDTSVSSQRLDVLEREPEDLKERVWATEQLIQDEKNLIASSKQEVEDLTTQLKTKLTELSTLSRQIVLGEDKNDEAAIAEADRVHLEAIEAIDEFLQ
jgi:hypothetical protein